MCVYVYVFIDKLHWLVCILMFIHNLENDDTALAIALLSKKFLFFSCFRFLFVFCDKTLSSYV